MLHCTSRELRLTNDVVACILLRGIDDAVHALADGEGTGTCLNHTWATVNASAATRGARVCTANELIFG
jgi:hypothetical protein